MKYALLIYDNEKNWALADDAARTEAYAQHGRFTAMLEERGAVRGGEELAPTDAATTVRDDGGGEFILTDGPYAETSEQLGGFYLVEAADLDEAIEYAKALPGAVVEVRPVVDHPAQ
ncbi:YciI family protein [Phytomonospora sp. NPDC050363]|uniref:YciI family protein n=1 Tax=Phytomonospora sp. NPDC050363 TaxID=3155642 RepID=UPI0033C47097